MPADLPYSAIAAVIGALLLWLGTRQTLRNNKANSKLDHAQQNYDQLQEDNGTLRGDKTKLEEQRDKAIAERDRAQSRERIAFDYAESLRQQIRDGTGPPPKPWPKELQ